MNKIRIEDLSIGDWVYHDDIVFGREIAKVHRLNKDKHGETIGITVYRSDGAFGVVGYICTSPTNNDIHPIPLTQEILEKNGFECIEVGDKGPATPKQNYMRYEHWRGETTWGRRDLFYDRMTKRWRFGGMNEYRFDSVHKLQHAIRFSGWDKEIEL